MKNKGSFNIDKLNFFTKINNITLLGEYNKITRDSIISGICKTNDCGNHFIKNFRTLIVNNSFYCEDCMIKIKVESRKTTHIKNCGFTTNLKCPLTKEKIKATNLIKFGCEHNSQNEEIKNKKIQTCIKNFGVNFPTQSKIVIEKSIQTSLKNYGVEHPSQNAEYAEKHSKTSYNRKEYTFPSGKKISYQGFENYALDNLIINEKIDESHIITGCKNVPTIWYNDENNKKHRHYVDIFIPSKNKCIEVKSIWTAEKKKDYIFLKQNAAKELGYNYEIWVYDGKGNIVNKYF
jgi:hypothetical protein